MTLWRKLAIAGIAAVVAYAVYDTYKPHPAGSASLPAKEAPAVRGTPRVKVAIKTPVTTLQGDAKANLKLPAAVQADDKQQVIQASQVSSNMHPQTVSTVVNTETGEVTTFTKIDPYPWFAIETRGVVGVAHGFKFKSALPVAERVTRLQIGYDVVRIKALTAGVTATVDTDRDAFVGVGISYKW